MRISIFIICFSINLLPTYLLATNDLNTINSSYFQNKVRKNILHAKPAQLKSFLCSTVKQGLPIFFSLLECKHRNITVENYDSKMVELMIALYKNGYKRIFLSEHTAFPVIVLLQEFTFNYEKNFDEIILWWNKQKNENNILQEDWAVSKIDTILQKNKFSKKDKEIIAGITLNFRVYFQDKKEFSKWWLENKNKNKKMWIMDSLEWAIDNVDNEDTKKSTTSNQLINCIMGVNPLLECGILKDKDDIPHILNKNDKKKLKEWFQKNKDTFNPFNRNGVVGIDLWKI